MRFTLLGTRGSRPILTRRRVTYGGNTTAFKITIEGMSPIYVDGGTGIFREGVQIVRGGQKNFRAHFLITHTHWDHILAFPFFAPLFSSDTRITIMGPRSEKYSIKALFEHQHNKGLIPIPFDLFRDRIDFRELHPNQSFQLELATVRTVELNHQGLTLGYRIEHGGKSVCIITDQAPIANNHLGTLMKSWEPKEYGRKEKAFEETLTAFVAGTDLMVYDTHFTKETIRGKENWGHSCPEMAVDVAVRAGVRRVVLGHHAPEDKDADVDRKIEAARTHLQSSGRAGGIEVGAMREGEDAWL
jgi:ribonuclease BN (tRNA processing enzyme)